jgi:hypothetical protein
MEDYHVLYPVCDFLPVDQDSIVVNLRPEHAGVHQSIPDRQKCELSVLGVQSRARPDNFRIDHQKSTLELYPEIKSQPIPKP